MAYDEDIASRLRLLVAERTTATEQQMFGGLAFLVGGHLAVGASSQGGVIVRAAPERWQTLLDTSNAEAFTRGGRPLTGWLHVDPDHVVTDEDLGRWVDVGVGYAESLDPKA